MPYLFTSEEYANVVFTFSVWVTASAIEYGICYINQRIPDSKIIRGLSSQYSYHLCSVQHHADIDEIIILFIERSLGTRCFFKKGQSHIQFYMVWRTLNQNRVYPYYK